MLLSLYFLATMIVFSMGLAAFFAAHQMYFRDTSSFRPFRTDLALSVPDFVGTRTHRRPIFGTDHDANPAQPDVFHSWRLHGAVAERRVPDALHVDIGCGVGAGGRGDRFLVLHLEGA